MSIKSAQHMVAVYAKGQLMPLHALPVVPLLRHFRVEAYRDEATTEYSGHDYALLLATLGDLCMEETLDKIVVYRDGAPWRRIEVTPCAGR